MENNYIPRATLKTFFEKNKIPTQEQFAQLINSTVIQGEDGLIKEDNGPLLLKTGPNNSQQRMVSFLTSFDDLSNTSWHMEMSPAQDFDGTRINVPGFSITDLNDHSRLFLKSGIRRMGIDTIQPEAHLHVATISTSGEHSFAAQQSNLSLTLGQKGANNQGSIMLYGSEGDKKVYQRANKGSFYIDSTDGEYRFNNDNFSEKGGVIRVFEKLSSSSDAGSVILNSEGPSYFKNPVGIGTMTPIPGVKLEVSGPAKFGSIMVSHDNNQLTTKTWMKGGIRMSRSSDILFLGLKDEGSNKQTAVLGWGDNATDKLHLKFIDHYTPVDDDGLDVLTLDGNGNVGFTNPNPIYPLDMTLDSTQGSWGKFTINMANYWDGNNNHATIGAGAAGVMICHPHVPYRDSRATIRYGRWNKTGHYFDAGLINTGVFRIAANGSNTKGIFLHQSGFLGVNKLAPSKAVDVDGEIRANRALLIENTSASGHVASFNTTSHEAPYVNWKHDGKRYFYLMAGKIGGAKNGVRFYAEQGSNFGFLKGKVGIHTETPAMPLHVLTGGGSANRYAIRIQNMSVPSNVWDIGVDNESPDTDLLFAYKGTYKAAIDEDGTYQKGSDKALKKNIKALAPALEKVMKLKPCTYQYKASVTGRTNIGMIAQEVEKYFPQVVRKKEFYTLDYNGFGVIAIKAIQEQQELINQLKKEIKEIKKSIG